MRSDDGAVPEPDLVGWTIGYYEARLAEHGPSARGVDWNSRESQERRFEELLRLVDLRTARSLLDYGCGYGSLATYLSQRRVDVRYLGYDVAPEMIATAQREVQDANCRFTSSPSALEPCDLVIASGIFNVRGPVEPLRWSRHVEDTLDEMWALTSTAMAFNMLSTAADRARMRDDLHYGDPAALVRHCIARYSRHVAVLHDSPLYEFTVVVRRNPWLGS